ncbi:MAG: hypothetical protein OXF73_09505 [Gammaproteobacteria bacterium]|nr:hypothetical protein [Gammaproteobacteria bacterium]
MTGGTYNVSNSFIQDSYGGSRSGCFQAGDGYHIRNCLCGRDLYTQDAAEQNKANNDAAQA